MKRKKIFGKRSVVLGREAYMGIDFAIIKLMIWENRNEISAVGIWWES